MTEVIHASGTTIGTGDIDVEFVEPSDAEAEQTTPGDRELPETVAEAVPPNAFEFVYEEDENTVRVNFVREIDADKVTIQAVASESEVSTSTPGPVTYLTVYLAPGGDEVVVTVTVDGVTGTVARESFGQ